MLYIEEFLGSFSQAGEQFTTPSKIILVQIWHTHTQTAIASLNTGKIYTEKREVE
jgi:hypothetical protein